MDNKKYNSNIGIIISLIAMAALVFSILFLWRLPIYILLKSVKVPENSVEVETKIIFSDVYWYHIIGERVIRCDDAYEKATQYIQDNNSKEKLNKLEVSRFFKDWDDFAVVPDFYAVDEKDYDKYIVITYYNKLE